MSDYVDVDSALRLPRALQSAETTVRGFDAALRLRQSARVDMRRIGCGFVLERKTRYTKPVESEVDPDVRIASRDGYLIIDHVHVSLLARPAAIIERLREGDLATMTAESRFQQILSDQRTGELARQARRIDEFGGFYRESFDILDRVGDTKSHAERLRLSNAGGEARLNNTPDPQPSSAEVSSAQEISDEHQVSTARGRQSGELPDRAPAG